MTRLVLTDVEKQKLRPVSARTSKPGAYDQQPRNGSEACSAGSQGWEVSDQPSIRRPITARTFPPEALVFVFFAELVPLCLMPTSTGSVLACVTAS